MNSYELSRNWFNWSFENPEKINPNHSAIFFFAIDQCNRLGWKKKFGFPTQTAMDAIGIKKHQTYIKYFNELCEWGFFELIQKSTNQHSANIISICQAMPKKGKATDKALDKATIIHTAKQTEPNGQSTGQSNSSIDKQVNNKQINNLHVGQENLPNPKPSIEKIDFKKLTEFLNKATGRNLHEPNQTVKNKYIARMKEGIPKSKIITAIINACKDPYHIETNFKYLTMEFFSRADKIELHGSEKINEPIKFKSNVK